CNRKSSLPRASSRTRKRCSTRDSSPSAYARRPRAPKVSDSRNASPEHLAAQQENDGMAVVLACEAALLNHPFQGRFLIDHALRPAQCPEQRLGYLFEHQQLRSRDAAVVAKVASVRSENEDRRTINHSHLRQCPSTDQQAGDASYKDHPPPAKSGPG